MRKVSLTIIALLLIAAMSLCVFADDLEVGLSADRTTVNRGDSIVVTVSVKEFASCKSGSLTLSYNENIFSCTGSEWLLSGLTMNTPESPAVFAFSSAKKVSGNIYQFTLKVADDAAFGTYRVSITLTLRDASGNPYAVTQMVEIAVECKHTYDGGTVTKAATCTTDGVKIYTCKQEGCTYTKTETIKATGHSYDKGQVTYEATCTDDGVKTYTCGLCGTTKTESIKATGHSYDDGKITTAATCTAAGEKTYTCAGCGVTKTESVKATGHSYDDDCDADCNTCGKERTVEHDYSTHWSFDENGHWHECTNCGDKLEMVPHTPGPDATEETDQICLDCGYVIETAKAHQHTALGDWLCDMENHWHQCGCGEIIDSGAHSWDAGTTNEAGDSITYQCTVCGYTTSEQIPVQDTQPTKPDSTEPTSTQGGSSGEPGGDDTDDPFPWLVVVLIILGLLLLAAVAFILVGIITSKRQKGRFTSD